jgi:hypothetical protein
MRELPVLDLYPILRSATTVMTVAALRDQAFQAELLPGPVVPALGDQPHAIAIALEAEALASRNI